MIGMSRICSASGLEGPPVGSDSALANSVGIFLEKTNVIRDFLEDVTEDRIFWPREVCVCV